jgi:hypothetical protein
MEEKIAIALIGLGVAVATMVSVILPSFFVFWVKMKAHNDASDKRAEQIKEKVSSDAKEIKASLVESEKKTEVRLDEIHGVVNSKNDKLLEKVDDLTKRLDETNKRLEEALKREAVQKAADAEKKSSP